MISSSITLCIIDLSLEDLEGFHFLVFKSLPFLRILDIYFFLLVSPLVCCVCVCRASLEKVQVQLMSYARSSKRCDWQRAKKRTARLLGYGIFFFLLIHSYTARYEDFLSKGAITHTHSYSDPHIYMLSLQKDILLSFSRFSFHYPS